jgi:hypothetical protein
MFEKMEKKDYLFLISLLLFTSSFLGLIFLQVVRIALIAASSYSCLCLSLALYVFIVILLLTSAFLTLINIDYDLVLVFTFFGILMNGGFTFFMLRSFFNTSYGAENITFFSALAFFIVLASTISLIIALIFTLKAKSKFGWV